MTNQNPQPDINVVINELTIQVANLTRENAILKATIQAMKTPPQVQNSADGGELQS